MKDFSNWKEYEGASEGSGRSEKLWLINPDTEQTGLFKYKKDVETTDHVSECIASGKDYLYLIWKSEQSRTQYIVGQLVKNGQYEFRYAKEVQAALNDGFTPLLCFPDVQKVYTDRKLFPVFASRLPDKRRKDIQDILKKYDLEQYDEYLLLKRSGARLPIDNFEFIDPIMNLDENVERKFFIAGVRHYLGCDGDNCEKSIMVTRGDEVILKREPGNQYDENAVRILDVSGHLLGYVPRYYSEGVKRMLESNKKTSCHVHYVDRKKNCNECIRVIFKCLS